MDLGRGWDFGKEEVGAPQRRDRGLGEGRGQERVAQTWAGPEGGGGEGR